LLTDVREKKKLEGGPVSRRCDAGLLCFWAAEKLGELTTEGTEITERWGGIREKIREKIRERD
jgi:hypothetical protein